MILLKVIYNNIFNYPQGAITKLQTSQSPQKNKVIVYKHFEESTLFIRMVQKWSQNFRNGHFIFSGTDRSGHTFEATTPEIKN